MRRLRGRGERSISLAGLPCIPVPASCVQTLNNPADFRQTLLRLIGQATTRILLSALYLQDDDAGREILAALYAAKARSPALQIAVFVDWHRAQRGLIGKGASTGNAAMYAEMAIRLGSGVPIYGVPVQTRELMGVLHLKGFVIDDTLLYSGASLNDVYLHRHDRYRLDRYHLIDSRQLADSMAALMTQVLLPQPAVCRLDTSTRPKTAALRREILHLRRALSKSGYTLTSGTIRAGEVGLTPLLGFGASDNRLNSVILQLIERARYRLVLLTPYFNLPGSIRRTIDEKIRRGCQVAFIIGDKTANDFFIPAGERFSAIGALPYLYENNLRRFCQIHQSSIAQGRLNVHLWRHENHTFHLKGLLVDDDYALLTGSNLNPRAWRLDLENGILLHDPHGRLSDQHQRELAGFLAHSRRLSHYDDLETVDSYPLPVQRLLKRLARTRADRLVNQVL
ncbi:MAG TPA: CDP-diacylglycerol--serine O-phosphatidyltransferase [Accumulibacter sp.]|nr:CDP-diacylglycerol--serine O-phosphatidyltransferase [Accumulibacter sp.]HND79945.1 CDP-diacylglycerol--serine O-phosphatidyltransferase [Accumulibacter sp.]HNE12494.1 CDP-diacylglycerol--serine O-phosphatidyltransferase [Accumulibacter sp.]HNL76990.1 CDP-diacylglycerol--serine O-phosphatidyltransferase [Accumulibacter sp.]HNO57159.1 CDP-diacylglycerol--serine O-phosphatidyltransferase [Accumulibacter sp.]